MFKNFSRHNLSLKKPSLLLNQANPCFVGDVDENYLNNLVDSKYFNSKNFLYDLNLFNSNNSGNNNPGPWGPWGANDSKTPNESSNNQGNNQGNKSGNNQGNNSPNKPDPKKDDKDSQNKKDQEESLKKPLTHNPNIDKNHSANQNNDQRNTKSNSYNSNNKNNHHQDQSQFYNPDFFDKIFDKINDFFKGLNGNKIKNFKNNRSDKSLFGLAILSLVLVYLSTGFYKVNTDENGAVLYFGKFYKIATPGLNYYLPFPFGQVIKKSVTTVNTEEFGFASDSKKSQKRNFDAESLMLTGDENIVDIEFQVQWQISDIKDYVFNIAEPNQSIRKSAESAMREIIARTPIADALSDGKQRIEQEAKVLLQEILDSYKAGVRIILVQMRRVDPPSQVIDAFRDVQTAKADKEKEINQAQAYANDIIPRARGLASQMLEQSQAYSKEIVANSEGEAGRFSSIYNQYSKAKQVTKKRLYLETMEQIYRNMDKVYIDKSIAKSAVLPYFPMANGITNDKVISQNQTENLSQSTKTNQKP